MNHDERQFEEFIRQVKLDDKPDYRHRDKLEQQLLASYAKRQWHQKQSQIGIWRTLMKSRMTRMAAAATVVLAVLVGVSFLFNGSVTFAQVIEPILNARNMVFDIFIGDEKTGTMMHEIVSGSRIRRTISNMPNLTQIIDLDSGKMLVLDRDVNVAVYVDIEGAVRDRTENYVAFVRDKIVRLQEHADATKLGAAEIAGVKAVGFSLGGPNEKVVVWADPETAHLLKIELSVGQLDAVMKNFEFDRQLDESLLSMDVPAGYTLQEKSIDLADATEQDFVESLRIWAEILGDGTFPSAIGTEATMQQMPVLVQKLMQSNVSEQEGTQTGMNFAKGMLFHQMLDTQGLDWRYAGAGVKLGDGQMPIFWYRPAGSENYRVIYADLSVREATAEQLPK